MSFLSVCLLLHIQCNNITNYKLLLQLYTCIFFLCVCLSLFPSDLDYWLQETEAKLSSDDLGRDIDGVEALAKKHQLLEAELLAQQVTYYNIHNTF